MPAIRCGELARFQTATTFQNPVPALDSPTTRVPLDAFDRLIDAVHGDHGQQQLLNGRDLRWGIDFAHLHRPQRHGWQALLLAVTRRSDKDLAAIFNLSRPRGEHIRATPIASIQTARG
jgi:hypothetical protein